MIYTSTPPVPQVASSSRRRIVASSCRRVVVTLHVDGADGRDGGDGVCRRAAVLSAVVVADARDDEARGDGVDGEAGVGGERQVVPRPRHRRPRRARREAVERRHLALRYRHVARLLTDARSRCQKVNDSRVTVTSAGSRPRCQKVNDSRVAASGPSRQRLVADNG